MIYVIVFADNRHAAAILKFFFKMTLIMYSFDSHHRFMCKAFIISFSNTNSIMKLFIEKESNAEEVKKIFATCYPYLKIELYKKLPGDNGMIAKREPLPLNVSMNQFIQKTGKSIINMDNEVTVAELENQFTNIGMIAEIFRKSGNVWVEASLTSNWTLRQQNMEGKEISEHFITKKTHTPT